jgi:hypothetical protein
MKIAKIFDDEIKVLIEHFRMKMACISADNGLDEEQRLAAAARYANILTYWELVLRGR